MNNEKKQKEPRKHFKLKGEKIELFSLKNFPLEEEHENSKF